MIAIKSGSTVKVTDENHPMLGWVGVVTPPRMWPRPLYKAIPDNSYRVQFDSGDGLFYGDYRENQLTVIIEAK
jgi:hypothetical protein